MSSPLTTVKLNDGHEIPWLGFGTGTALVRQDPKVVSDNVKLALENGLTHLDSADLYQNEDATGDSIVQSGLRREALYITTKLHGPREGYTVRQQLEESLKKLKVDYVDLYLVHIPLQWVGQMKEMWKEMEELKQAGLAKSIGVSNFKPEHLKELLEGASIVPAVNQIEYHPYVFKAAQEIINSNREHGIVTESYSALSPMFRVADGPVTPVLEKITERLSNVVGKPITQGQVLVKWQQQQGIVVVTTTSKVSRMHEMIAVQSLPSLTEEEVRSIEDAGSKLHKRFFVRRVFGDQ